MASTIESIWTTPHSAEPMLRHEKVSLVAGKGIVGDRYYKGCGTYTLFDEPGRQLTIISADAVETALERKGQSIDRIGNLRRQVVVRGISEAELNEAVGCTVDLGECAVFVHRRCVPCMYNERKNGLPGMMDTLWDSAGVSAEVVRGGELTVGDTLRVVPGSRDESRIRHGKSEDFFTRPSKRSAAVVRAQRDGLAAAKPKMEAKDPVGVRRIAEAYASVGIGFWPTARREPDDGGDQRSFTAATLAQLLAVLVPLAAVLYAVTHYIPS
jgi:MOSC domain-containing protein YiiM